RLVDRRHATVIRYAARELADDLNLFYSSGQRNLFESPSWRDRASRRKRILHGPEWIGDKRVRSGGEVCSKLHRRGAIDRNNLVYRDSQVGVPGEHPQPLTNEAFVEGG